MTTHLHGFGQFLSLLPHQFGFVPDRSVIVAAMSGTQVIGMLRFDDDAPVFSEPGVEAVGPLLRRATAGSSDVSWVVVEYRVEIGAARSEGLTRYLEREIAPVQHVFVVAGDVWWATRCQHGCCDGALHELDVDTATEQAVEAGLHAVPSASRVAATASLRYVDHERMQDVTRCLGALTEVEAQEALDAWENVLTVERASSEALARVVAVCADPQHRDRILWSLVPELAPTDEPQAQTGGRCHDARRDVLSDSAVAGLERSLPAISGPARATWLAFLALARWRAGDQTGAGLAAEEAVAVGATTPLVNIVAAITEQGIAYPRAPAAFSWPRAAGF